MEELIRANAHPLRNADDLAPLLQRIGDARVVMLGEASHGTHEYYTWRSLVSKQLITEKQFNFIAVEGDWPDCYRVNRYAKGDDAYGKTALDVLKQFERWPTWMWANWEVAALAEWLRARNKTLPRNRRAGFYGLDVYSLWESLDAIMKYLKTEDPKAYQTALDTFRCFEPFKEDGTRYAYASRIVPELCENDVVKLLQEIQRKLPLYDHDEEHVFSTEQNALVAVNAEKYYRAMIRGGADSWNVRDMHMIETLERLLDFHGANAKAIVWAHNTHIGDASATDMADDGMYNLGELARQRFGNDSVVLVGFGSYEGSVIAGRNWGAAMEKMPVPQGVDGSWEHALHASGAENKLLLMDDFMPSALSEQRIGHRAIGVVYKPDIEQYGNYVPSVMPLRYDAFLYIDKTHALHPLHLHPHGGEVPDTYPFGV